MGAAPGWGKPARNGTEPPPKGLPSPIPPVLPQKHRSVAQQENISSMYCTAVFSLIQPRERQLSRTHS